ncbi:intracellular protein transport protein USO1-like [Nicotiana sylvestris]|uniref:intracellular protein transport protein USO1-like n=1 Tax=Nicotiana sylvestris TaxID=4096 RepID=UPI00388C54BF
MSFPEEWNTKRHRDGVLMRLPLLGEEQTSKPDKGKKRKKEASAEYQESKKTKACKPKTDDMVLTLTATTTLREDDDVDDRPLVQRARQSADALRAIGQKATEAGAADAKKMYDHAFSNLYDELSCREEELKKLTSKLNELKASSAHKEEELNELRFRKKDALVGQLQEEVAAKDAEILELKRQNEVVISDRDLLRGELASTQGLLQSSKEEVTVLSVAKAEADEDASSYKIYATTVNDRAREISKKAEQKLARAVDYACLQARRQAFEEASAECIDLSAEIEKSRTLEEE